MGLLGNKTARVHCDAQDAAIVLSDRNGQQHSANHID